MCVIDTIDPVAPSVHVDESDKISEFSYNSYITPSVDSKTGQKAPTDEDLSKLDDRDGAETDTINLHLHLKGIQSSPSKQVLGLLKDSLNVVPKSQVGEILTLSIQGEGKFTVKINSGEQLEVVQTNNTNDLVATIYRTHGDRRQTIDAPEKVAAPATDRSSLLFHRSELFKARTIRVLTGSKYVACSADCSKKEPATAAGATATSGNDSPSLSALIDIAKAKIHHGLTTPEHTGCIGSSSTVSAKKKPEKKAKKVVAGKIKALRFHRVLNFFQFCVIIFLLLIIFLLPIFIGRGQEADAKKNHRIGSWLGA